MPPLSAAISVPTARTRTSSSSTKTPSPTTTLSSSTSSSGSPGSPGSPIALHAAHRALAMATARTFARTRRTLLAAAQCAVVMAFIATPFLCFGLGVVLVSAAISALASLSRILAAAPTLVHAVSAAFPIPSVLAPATHDPASPFLEAALHPVHFAVLAFWIAYGFWIARDWHTPTRGGTERLRWIRSWSGWSRLWAPYFPVSMMRCEPLELSRNYIFGMHPHGLYCLGAYSNFVVQHAISTPSAAADHAGPASSLHGYRAMFPGLRLRLATLRINFALPLWRELQLAWGFISVDYKSCRTWLMHGDGDCDSTGAAPLVVPVPDATAIAAKIKPEAHFDSAVDLRSSPTSSNGAFGAEGLVRCESPVSDASQSDGGDTAEASPPPPPPHGAGRTLLICIGGAEESLLTRPKRMDLVLLKRKGFVKLALDTGSSMVPVISFGETELYQQFFPAPGSPVYRVQRWMKKSMGWTFPLVYGRIGMLLPYRHPVTTVVGKAIHVPYTPNPSRDLVEQYHQLYIEKVRELWAEYKDRLAPAGAEMHFVA
ncbi:diacylglycerol acyltransferase-domain-containing protein [Blastocladiella britannica]|nr:diacylglycerol acyltransferase-domain-containing protein [Blastocladiella britannica]